MEKEYWENLCEEVGQLLYDLKPIVITLYNFAVQSVHVGLQAVPYVRKFLQRVKEFKAEL